MTDTRPGPFRSRAPRPVLFALSLGWRIPPWAAAVLATPLAYAEDTVCARVKIEIKQELTLERQGFEAEMKINNATDTAVIENVAVAMKVTEEDGTPVAVTGDPDDLSARFFLRLSGKRNISDVDGTGTVDPKTSAVIDWLLVPAPGSAGSGPFGKKYLVGAILTYTFNGERTVLEVSPDVITVKPLPLLTLDYFLPRDVWADDPLTPEIEPAEPFTLGVRVRNTGQADAKRLAIDSAQPRIVENDQGLLIHFLLTGSYVDDAPARNSLLLDFGDLAAGTARMGRWNMETTLAGQFVEFTARFSHSDELGGALTSLLQAANTHTLIRDVRADLPGRDTVRDFLARDGGVIRLYESDGLDSEVTDRSAAATLVADTAPPGQPRYRLSFPATAGFVYVQRPDPFHGQKVPGPVVRSDAKRLAAENVWLSKTRNAATREWRYWINFFDANTPGLYDAEFQDPASIPRPPVLQFIPDRTVRETRQVSFLVEASSPDGKPVTLTATPLPSGAKLTPEAADPAPPGLARALFDWTPAHGTAGEYPITYTAGDGALSATRTAKITVEAAAALGPTPPAAHSDRATTRKEVAVTLPILANDRPGVGAAGFDLAGLDLDPATPAADTTRTVPGEGSFSLSPAGTVRFEPLPTFTGVSTITYRVRDDLGQSSNPANITVTVAGPGNPAGDDVTDQPVANPDEGTTPRDAILTLDALLNDVAGAGEALVAATLDLDPDADGEQAQRTTPQGAWQSNGDGTVTFAPATGFSGTATLPYAIADGAGRTARSTLAVTVTGGAAPIARDDSGATGPAAAIVLSVLANDSASAGAQRVPDAIDLDPSTPGQVDTTAATAEGTWTALPDGTVGFTPAADDQGSGRPFTGTATRPYAMTDSLGLSAGATMTVEVNPSQEYGAPTAANDRADTPFQAPVTLHPAGNDTAGPGAVLNPTTLDLDPATEALDRERIAAEGTWRVEADGQVTFTPAASFAGTTAARPYRVRDSLGNAADATLAVTVAPPDGLAVSGTVFHDLDRNRVQGGGEPGTDAGGLYVTAATGGNAAATVPVNADGTYTLPVTANTSYTLVLSTVSNGTAASLPAGWSLTGENLEGAPDGGTDGRLSVTVGVASLAGRNFGILGAAPVANDDTAATAHGTAVTLEVLANDTQEPGGTRFDPATLDLDPEADGIQARFSVPGEGTYDADPATGAVTFAPLPAFSGIATPIPYVVADDLGRPTQAAAITVAVGPEAVDDSAGTPYQAPFSGTVADNDRYPAGAAFAWITPPAHGSLTHFDPATGAYAYAPAAGYSGPDQFTYRLCLPAPNDTLCATAAVTLTVAAPILPPELRIETSASSSRPAVGLPFTYTLTLTHSGGPATDPVRVVDAVPAGVRLTGVQVPAGWACMPAVSPSQPLQGGNGAVLACSLAAPLATGSQTLRLTAIPTSANGSFTNAATVTGDGQLPDTTHCDGSAPANCGQVSVTPANPQLALAGRVSLAPADETGTPDGRVQAGERLTYTYSLANRGDVPLSSLAVADAQLDGGSLGCAASTAQGQTFALADPRNTLAVNDSVVCTGRHTVTAGEEAAGRSEHTATALGRAPDGSPWLSVATGTRDDALPAARLSLSGTAVHHDADGNGGFDQGETVTSGFLVRNVGHRALGSLAVSVDDPLFPPVTCPPDPLAAGAQAVCTAADAVLTLDDETAGRVVHTATATALDPDGHGVAATTTRMLYGGQAAALELRQSAVLATDQGTPGLSAGDTLTYTLAATNTGGLALNNVTVTGGKLGAALQAVGACAPAQGSSLDPGAGLVCTAAYTVQAGEADPIDNAAHASGKPVGRHAPVEASSHLVLPYLQATGPVLYTLGDRVWLDSNRNGVLEAAETGVDSVVIRLQVGHDTAWTQATHADGTPIPDQITAGGGYYRFTNIPQNSPDQRYRVSVLPVNFKLEGGGTQPLYGAGSSYVDDTSAFPWTDGRDQGIGSSANPTNGMLSRTLDLNALPDGTKTLNSVDFGFVKVAVTSPDLAITNTPSTAAVNRNGTLTYTLQASNAAGSGLLSRTPVVLDTLPAGMTVAAGWPAAQPARWSCTVGANRQSVSCIFDKAALPLAGGTDLGDAIVIPVKVGATMATGSVKNTATITHLGGEPSFDNNAASATVTVNP